MIPHPHPLKPLKPRSGCEWGLGEDSNFQLEGLKIGVRAFSRRRNSLMQTIVKTCTL